MENQGKFWGIKSYMETIWQHRSIGGRRPDSIGTPNPITSILPLRTSGKNHLVRGGSEKIGRKSPRWVEGHC